MARLKQETRFLGALPLQLAILCATRPSEAYKAEWAEFDLKERVWSIPGARMKARKMHEIPLSTAAMRLLDRIAGLRRGPYLFASDVNPDMHISKAPMPNLLDRLGMQATAHGFRSSFRDWIGDETDFPSEIAELALAHTVGDATKRAYRRKKALERRREAMEAWGRFCEGGDSNVISLPVRRTG
jgi:integrase